MKKKYIIKKSQDFENIINEKKLVKTPYFNFFRKKNDLGYIRYGIGISNKIKNKVIKNKIKRQLKAIIRMHNIKQSSFDYVIIVKSNILRLDFLNFKAEFLKFFSKINNEGEK